MGKKEKSVSTNKKVNEVQTYFASVGAALCGCVQLSLTDTAYAPFYHAQSIPHRSNRLVPVI